MIPRNLRQPLAALAVLACATLAAATVVLRADVDRLAELADVVVDGKVERRSVVFEAAQGAVWTRYEVRVSETLLGTERAVVTVHVPGGRAGDLVQEVSGTAQLKVGHRTVLFLTNEEDRLLVLGQAQGCFRVEKAADGKTLVCKNDVEGLALVDEAGRHVEGAATEMRHAALVRRVARVARKRAEDEERRRAEREKRLDELRERAERNAERTRGKPGGAQ
jgi:hypothetical protein